MSTFWTLFVIFVVSTVSLGNEWENYHWRDTGIGGVAYRRCPRELPPGLPRKAFVNYPKYYPIGDREAEELLMEEIVGRDSDFTFRGFLRRGCPIRSPVNRTEMENWWNVTAFGTGQVTLVHCRYTSPRLELACEPLDGNPNTNFHYHITLSDDQATYAVSTRCYDRLNLYTWIVFANVPVLPLASLQEIRNHVTSLGFNWNYARPIRYDHCISCS